MGCRVIRKSAIKNAKRGRHDADLSYDIVDFLGSQSTGKSEFLFLFGDIFSVIKTGGIWGCSRFAGYLGMSISVEVHSSKRVEGIHDVHVWP